MLKTVITQNVDGLHTAGGSVDVLELHGNETQGICMAAGCRHIEPYAAIFNRLGWTDANGCTTGALSLLISLSANSHTLLITCTCCYDQIKGT